MKSYDPLVAPDPDHWLSLSEDDRLELIREYHQDNGVDLPNPELHAAMHCIVENQAAMGEELSVRETLLRLVDEGLDRHDAVHAVASVLCQDIFAILKGEAHVSEERYAKGLQSLTAKGWLKS